MLSSHTPNAGKEIQSRSRRIRVWCELLAGSRLRLESGSTVLILRVVVCGVGGACRFAYVLIADHAAHSLCQIVAEDPRACCLISICPW